MLTNRTGRAPAGVDRLSRRFSRVKLGITEFNEALVWSSAARREIIAQLGRWRDALTGLHHAYFSLMINWPALQLDAAHGANLDLQHGGCISVATQCGGWAGVREQLVALVSR